MKVLELNTNRMQLFKRLNLVLVALIFSTIISGQEIEKLHIDSSNYQIKCGGLTLTLDSALNNKTKVFDLLTKTQNLYSFFKELTKTDTLAVKILSLDSTKCKECYFNVRAVITMTYRRQMEVAISSIPWYCHFFFKRVLKFIAPDEAYELVHLSTEI